MIDFLRGVPGDDSGVALLTVVGVALVLFLLATMVLTFVTYQIQASTREQNRVKALHIADAGINAYLYEVKVHYSQLPTSLSGVSQEGSWTVTKSAATSQTPMTLRSRGVIPALGVGRTIVATVRYPSFADYMFLTADDINIGASAVITGKVRANGTVNNAGWCQSDVISHTSITTQAIPPGNGRIDGRVKPNQPAVDFNGVIGDIAAMRTTAQGSGTAYIGQGGTAGYLVVFDPGGTSVTITKVTSANKNGVTLGTVIAANVPIPGSGVFYFDSNVWTEGSYAANCTFACNADIYITGNITPVDPNASYTCGLVAEHDVIVPLGYTTPASLAFTDNMNVTACLLARSGTIHPDTDQWASLVRNSIEFHGSMAYNTFSWMCMIAGNGQVVDGFANRLYDYDERADANPPPSFPVVHDGSMKVSTWIEK